MTDKLKIGVVGLGRWGRNLLRTARQAAEVTVICDANKNRMVAASEDFHRDQLFANYDKMLAEADVNAVIIATPAKTHAEMAVKALEAGKHVFVEKPMAMSTEEAELIESTIMRPHFHGRPYLPL